MLPVGDVRGPLHSSSNWTPEYKRLGAGFSENTPPVHAVRAGYWAFTAREGHRRGRPVRVHVREIVPDKPEGRPVVLYVIASPLIQLFMSPPAFSAFHHITYTCSSDAHTVWQLPLLTYWTVLQMCVIMSQQVKHAWRRSLVSFR